MASYVSANEAEDAGLAEEGVGVEIRGGAGQRDGLVIVIEGVGQLGDLGLALLFGLEKDSFSRA